jgi:hypothetical protein
MKNSPLVFSAIFVILSFSSTLHAETEAQLLDKLEQDKSDFNRLLVAEIAWFQKFDALPKAEALLKIKERVDWLAIKVAKPDSDYRFGYSLAVYQWKFGDERNAALTVARSDVRSYADSLRCADNTSPSKRIGTWRAAVQPVYQIIKNSTSDQKGEIRKAFEQEETQLNQRSANPWMCNGGAQQITKLLEKYPEIGGMQAGIPSKAIVEKYPSVIRVRGNNVELVDNSILPDFVDGEKWSRTLPEMLNGFKKNYFSMLSLN